MGQGPDSGTKMYRIEYQDHAIIVGANLDRHQLSFAAVSDEPEALKNGRTYVEYRILLADQLDPKDSQACLDLLIGKKKLGQVMDKTEDYGYRTGFSLINPFVSKEKLLGWFKSYYYSRTF